MSEHQKPKAEAISMSDIESDVIFLLAHLQGVEVIMEAADTNGSPASNALYAAVKDSVAKADRLTERVSTYADCDRRADTQTTSPAIALEPVKDSACDLYARWQAIRSAAKAAADRENDVELSPELKALNAEDERLGQLIAASVPNTNEDAAAMLSWVIEDIGLTVVSAEYAKAITAAARFLRKSSPAPVVHEAA